MQTFVGETDRPNVVDVIEKDLVDYLE